MDWLMGTMLGIGILATGIDEVHNCNNPEYIENQEYEYGACNWERTDFDYVRDEKGKVIFNEDRSTKLILKRKVVTDTRLKRKYRDKYWKNEGDK